MTLASSSSGCHVHTTVERRSSPTGFSALSIMHMTSNLTEWFPYAVNNAGLAISLSGFPMLSIMQDSSNLTEWFPYAVNNAGL